MGSDPLAKDQQLLHLCTLPTDSWDRLAFGRGGKEVSPATKESVIVSETKLCVYVCLGGGEGGILRCELLYFKLIYCFL